MNGFVIQSSTKRSSSKTTSSTGASTFFLSVICDENANPMINKSPAINNIFFISKVYNNIAIAVPNVIND